MTTRHIKPRIIRRFRHWPSIAMASHRCVLCGAPTIDDRRVRYCSQHTQSKGTKIRAADCRGAA